MLSLATKEESFLKSLQHFDCWKKKNYLHNLAGGNFKKYNHYFKINALKSALCLLVSR